MIQTFQTFRTFVVTAADTSAALLHTDFPGRSFTVQADVDNAGDVYIVGVSGGEFDDDGFRLAAGDLLGVWATNANQIGYKADNAGDKLRVAVGG